MVEEKEVIPPAFGGLQDELMAAAASTSSQPEEGKASEPFQQPFEEPDQVPEKEPLWLGDLIHESFYDKLVIIGFPYDEGAKKAGSRKGADYGPGK